MNLIFNQLFKDKLSRINSPVSQAILELEGKESEKLEISYLGISVQNPIFISYLDTSRVNRIHKEASTPRKVIESISFVPKPEFYSKLNELDSDFPAEYKPEYLGKNFHKQINCWSNDLVFTDEYEFLEDFFLKDNRQLDFNGGNWPLRNICLFHTKDCFKYMDYTIYTIPYNIDVNELLYDPNKRYHSSAGKAIRRILAAFDQTFTDKQIEEFVGLYKLESFKECGNLGDLLYEELKEEDIRWAYYEDNYYGNGGTLHASCMRYGNCQDYLDIYTQNPDKISLAVLKKEGKIAARSLLWEHDEGTLFDRVYFINEETKLTLQAKLQSLGYKDVYEGDYKSDSYFIKLKATDFRYYPYMDTFQYLKIGQGLSNDCTINYDWELTNAEGGPMHDESDCDCCGDTWDNDDLHHVDIGRYRGQSLCNDCCTWLESDEYVHTDQAVYCHYVGGYYFEDDVIELHNGHYAHKDDAYELHDGNYALLDDTVTLHDGERALNTEVTAAVNGDYYLTDDIDKFCVEFKGEWYPHSHNKIVEVDGTYYHEDSEEYQELISYQEIAENEEAQKEAQDQEKEIKFTEFTETTINIQESNEFIL